MGKGFLREAFFLEKSRGKHPKETVIAKDTKTAAKGSKKEQKARRPKSVRRMQFIKAGKRGSERARDLVTQSRELYQS